MSKKGMQNDLSRISIYCSVAGHSTCMPNGVSDAENRAMLRSRDAFGGPEGKIGYICR